jgi:hypothetical protein
LFPKPALILSAYRCPEGESARPRFALGALQALDETAVLKRVDYLSTVSGGGYIGCSLSACLEAKAGDFPFAATRFEDETPALQHIRDYSNYLLPNRALDAVHNIAIYFRGLAANFILVTPFLLIAAAITIILNPLYYRNVSWREMGKIAYDSAILTAAVVFLLAVASIYQYPMGVSGVPQMC